MFSGFIVAERNNDYVSPLNSFSSEWNEAKYAVANTAADVTYMSNSEKEVIHILNLARLNPTLFCNTVIKQYPVLSGRPELKNSEYYISLVVAMKKQQPLNVLQPDKRSFESAQCHAETSGETGYVGHDRKSKDCKRLLNFTGECCDYGNNNPIDIVLSLLIDEDIPSLSHRTICLTGFNKIGVSIQPHKSYRYNTVMDFNY